MWNSGREQTKPEYFDEAYRSNPNIWRGPDKGILDRIVDAQKLIGDHTGLSILDIGGGALLCKALKGVKRYTLVDYSPVACQLAKEIAPWIETECMDAFEYIPRCQEQYDLTILMGCIEYGPPDGLSILFQFAPSKELILYVPVTEAYVLHIERTVVPSRKDIEDAARLFHWKMIDEVRQNEHVFAKYRRW